MNLTNERSANFKNMMSKIARQHDCVLNIADSSDASETRMVISDAVLLPVEYVVVWAQEHSLTEAAVTIWADFFKRRAVGYRDTDMYIKQDIDMTKLMYKEVVNNLYGVKANKLPKIERVIFNAPATIVFWSDKTKTVVKAQGEDEFDPEKGLAMVISKKALGNKGNYYNVFDEWVEWPVDEDEAVDSFIHKLPSYSDDLWDHIRNKLLEKFSIHVTADKNGKVLNKEVTEVKEPEKKYSPVAKAYTALVRSRDEGRCLDVDEIIGYLGEALAE